MITVTGQLLDPMAIPEAEVTIRVEALSNTVALLHSSASTETTEEGNYNFNLVEGSHRIEVNFHDEFVVTGEIEVTSEMSGETYTLSELLNLVVLPTT